MKTPWLIALVFLILAVTTGFFGAWQYGENQRLAKENTALKQQLNETSDKLWQMEQDKATLQQELNMTNTRVAQLQTQVTTLNAQVQNLTQQVEKLREQLKLKNYITIGLTFLWSPSISVNQVSLAAQMHDLNSKWDQAGVYYFLYHASAASFVPGYLDLCNLEQWTNRAKALYPGPDIPIAIIAKTNSKWAGCAFIGRSGIAVRLTAIRSLAGLLTHELLHNFGIGDDLLKHEVQYVPSSQLIYDRIHRAAKQYQMPLPQT